MLYLLRSYGVGGRSILKIGFTDNIEARAYSYFSSNPFILMISVREGDTMLESLIHRYLYSLGLQYNMEGRSLEEWFIDDPRVLSIFHISRETLERIMWSNRDKIFNIKTYPSTDYSLFEYLYKKHEDSFEGNKYRTVNEKAVKTKAKSIDLDFWKFYSRNMEKDSIDRENISQETSDFFDEFYSTGVFAKRMKMFCEFMDTHKGQPEIIGPVLEKVDPKFNNFYSLIGTKKCKALDFKESALKDRLNLATNSENLKKKVLEVFKVGERYTRKFIKGKLGEIYKSMGIKTKSPKANDIEEWFNARPVKIREDDGRENGFEILGIK